MIRHPVVLILLLFPLPGACGSDPDPRSARTGFGERPAESLTGSDSDSDSALFSSFDWRAFLRTWEAYIADPAPHTGSALSGMVPAWSEIDEFWETWDRPREPDQMSKAIDTAMFWGVPIIGDQIEQGDSSAVRLAVRLRRMSTGHMSEELDIAIGMAMIPMPEVFLRTLQEERVPRDEYDGILGNLGPEYVDRERESAAVLQRRRAALLTVDDPELRALRDSLVEAIDRDLVIMTQR